jgi:SnoaL-like polyketide cyclase
MDASWLDQYVVAWSRHPEAGGEGGEEALKVLLSFMDENVRYEDVATASVWTGHVGIREMGAGALRMSSDMSFEPVQRVFGDDGVYAFEGTWRGTNTGTIGPLPGDGASFSIRTVSIGEVSKAGLVVSQRDYMDLAGLLGQLGVSVGR